MTKFLELLEHVADEQNHSLASILLQAKLLAARLRSRKFRQWVDLELNGYQSNETIPDYRTIRPMLLADFWGPFGAKVKNVPITLTDFPKELRDYVENYYFFDNVASLEAMLDANTETFHRHIDVELVELIRRGPGIRVTGHELQVVTGVFTKPAIRGVIHAIRTRLLDFLIELRDKYPELEQEQSAVNNIPPEAVTELFDRSIYHQCTFVTSKSGDPIVGDTYNTGQAGAVGPGASASNMTFQQIWQQNASAIDLPELSDELAMLVDALRKEASEPEQEIAVGNVSAAQKSAAAGDGPKTLEYLEHGGGWVLDVAQKIGIGVAIAAIKTAIGA